MEQKQTVHEELSITFAYLTVVLILHKLSHIFSSLFPHKDVCLSWLHNWIPLMQRAAPHSQETVWSFLKVCQLFSPISSLFFFGVCAKAPGRQHFKRSLMHSACWRGKKKHVGCLFVGFLYLSLLWVLWRCSTTTCEDAFFSGVREEEMEKHLLHRILSVSACSAEGQTDIYGNKNATGGNYKTAAEES